MKIADYPIMVKTSKIGLRQIEGQDLRMHWGIDFSVRGSDKEKNSTQLFALYEGVVTAVNSTNRSSSGGLYVYVTTKLLTKYITYRYYHFSSINVKKGDKVKQGQFLGIMGNTGVNSTGPHLHVECFLHDIESVGASGKSTDINKSYIDPLILIDLYSASHKAEILDKLLKSKQISLSQYDAAIKDKYLMFGPNAFYWFVTDEYTFVDYKWVVTKKERLNVK